MRSRGPHVLALAGGLVALAIGTIVVVIPWWTSARDLVSSVPGPAPLSGFAPLRLAPRSTACATNVVIDTDAGRVQVLAHTAKPGPPLSITASGPGYRSHTVAPGGLAGDIAYTASIQPPRHSLIGSLCVRNPGRRALTLMGNLEPRSNAMQQLRVDGRPLPTDLVMTIYRARRASFATSFGTLLDRAATLKFTFLRGWMLWPLALFVFFGVLAIPLWALVRTWGADG